MSTLSAHCFFLKKLKTLNSWHAQRFINIYARCVCCAHTWCPVLLKSFKLTKKEVKCSRSYHRVWAGHSTTALGDRPVEACL